MPIDPQSPFADKLSTAEDLLNQLFRLKLDLQASEVTMLTLEAGIQMLQEELRLQREQRPLPNALYQDLLHARRERAVAPGRTA